MTATMTIDQALVRVDEAVEKVKNDAEQRFPDAASVGDAVRQGDIYIQKIDDLTDCPKMYRELRTPQYPCSSRRATQRARGTCSKPLTALRCTCSTSPR